MTELPRNLHIPEPVMLLLQAEDRMGDHWSEASTYARQSMWQTESKLLYRTGEEIDE